jgi:hypothetical protein
VQVSVSRCSLFIPLSLEPLALFAFQFADAVLRCWEIFWHGAANVGNELPHTSPHFMVASVGLLLTGDALAFDLGIGLRGSEDVGT